MNKEEYEDLWKELTEAEVVTLHDFEKREYMGTKEASSWNEFEEEEQERCDEEER